MDFNGPPLENFSSPVAPPPASNPPGPRKQKKERPNRRVEVILIALSLAAVLFMATILFVVISFISGIQSLFTPAARNANPPGGSFSVITVSGTIQTASGGALGVNEPSYHHTATLNYIKQLAENDNDKGILLYMNTPGGGVYESDEIYRALEKYKEETGRPVWAYMGQTCASGGYYISAAAQHIIANYNTTTGSIGVYITLTDTSGLYEKLGVETVLIRSGENKAIGTDGVPITSEQQAIYQSMVDEIYNRFVEVVSIGRGMDAATVRKLGDGRPYTANQALENGLVDELGEWDGALANFEELTGGRAFYPSFSTQTKLGGLLSEMEPLVPQGDTEASIDFAQNLPSGVPMMYAPGLAWGEQEAA